MSKAIEYLKAYLPSDIVIQDEKLGDNGCSLTANIKFRGRKCRMVMCQEMIQDISQILNNVYSDKTGPIPEEEIQEWKNADEQLGKYYDSFKHIKVDLSKIQFLENDGSIAERKPPYRKSEWNEEDWDY